jgi:uncharacterized protein YwgA
MNNELSLLNSMLLAMKKENSWRGETHIQKNIYILKALFDEVISFNFILYKHGPYSFELKDALQEFLAVGKLSIKKKGAFGPSYEVVDTARINEKSFLKKIDFVAKLTGNKNVSELEKLSTALYIIKSYKDMPDYKKAEKFNEFKPHISKEEAFKEIKAMETIIEKAKNSH